MTNLSFGGGTFDVLLDFADRNITVYNGGEEFHARYGGRQYYKSWSGLSGAGWIPTRLDRIVVRGYRTETESPWAAMSPIGGELEVGIPTCRAGASGQIADGFPALVRMSSGLVLCHVCDLFAVLCGGTGTQHEYAFEYFAAAGEDSRTFCERYDYVGADWWIKKHRGNVHAVLRALRRECFFRPDDTQPSMPFWRRLGLHWQADGRAYKVAKGVAWERYAPADLQTREQRQDAAPANVLFLSPLYYLQRDRDGNFEAVGISECGGYDYEAAVSPHAAMRALMGDHAAITAELDRGIATKAAVDRGAAAGIDKLTAAIAANAGLVLTIADGLAAGACRVGIERFRDEHFPGRDSVTVAELAPHVTDRDVERVLRHALFRS